MKKLITGAALVLATTLASAQYSAITSYEYERADGKADIHSTHLGQAGIRYNTELGSFDLVGSLKQTVTGVRVHDGGVEVGFNKPIKMGDVTLVGSASAGTIDEEKYYRLGAEGFVKIVDGLDAYGGYRFTNSFGNDNVPATNRYVVGLKAAVASNLDAKAGITQTRYSNEKYNGITAGLEFKF